MDWKRGARRDLLVGGAGVLGMVGLVVLGAGNRAAEPTATTAPAPVPAAEGSVTVAARTSTGARHRPVVPSEIAGEVRDAAARPEARIAVSFVAADGTVRSAATTAEGTYALVLPDGAYRVVCTVPGESCTTDSGGDAVLVAGPAIVDLWVRPGARG